MDGLVSEVAARVLSRLQQEGRISSMPQRMLENPTHGPTPARAVSGATRRLSIVLTGADRRMEEALAACLRLCRSFPSRVFLTSSAARTIPADRLKAAGISEWATQEDRPDAREWASRTDVLLLPNLSLAALGRITGLCADSFVPILTILCLQQGKPVVAARDSLWAAASPEPSPGAGLARRLEEVLYQARMMGIRITTLSQLAGEVLAAAGGAPAGAGGLGPAVSFGTAGKVFASGPAPWPSETRAAVGPPAMALEEWPARDRQAEHTGDSSCPHCQPLSKFSEREIRDEIGADRIAVCHPTEKCDPVARIIDHTLLKPNATQEEIAKLCEEARRYCFASVCVNPAYVPLCADLLKGSGVRITTVVGFPLGATTPTVKAIEARDAIANGADEIDMVINVGALKSGNDALVLEDIRAVREATRGKILKVILETAYLTREEKIRACLLAKEAGADFVKTSTGFGPSGATVEDIRLMRETVGPAMGIKAAGGIRDLETARKMAEAGATRIGASASVAIVTGRSAGGGKY